MASEMSSDGEREVKVVLLGHTGVGKSSLVKQFTTNSFSIHSQSTIGASFMSKLVSTGDGKSIKFQIWDTAGQEKYHSLAPMYYRGAAAAIIVYDITRKHTFETLQKWVDELRSLGPEDIVISLAGNKCDLESSRMVDASDAAAYADEIGATHWHTSAKDNTNVHELFVEISKRLPDAAEQPYGMVADIGGDRGRDGDGKSKCCS